mmetsp:Transcript_32239/g.45851  ORF Transcript_32239/g.45851 Transcript_32239/m.45851 type:complete len:84 (+) Transcript_32239:923-1174(+)
MLDVSSTKSTCLSGRENVAVQPEVCGVDPGDEFREEQSSFLDAVGGKWIYRIGWSKRGSYLPFIGLSEGEDIVGHHILETMRR